MNTEFEDQLRNRLHRAADDQATPTFDDNWRTGAGSPRATRRTRPMWVPILAAASVAALAVGVGTMTLNRSTSVTVGPAGTNPTASSSSTSPSNATPRGTIANHPSYYWALDDARTVDLASAWALSECMKSKNLKFGGTYPALGFARYPDGMVVGRGAYYGVPRGTDPELFRKSLNPNIPASDITREKSSTRWASHWIASKNGSLKPAGCEADLMGQLMGDVNSFVAWRDDVNALERNELAVRSGLHTSHPTAVPLVHCRQGKGVPPAERTKSSSQPTGAVVNADDPRCADELRAADQRIQARQAAEATAMKQFDATESERIARVQAGQQRQLARAKQLVGECQAATGDCAKWEQSVLPRE